MVDTYKTAGAEAGSRSEEKKSVVIGQEVIGKFQTSNGIGSRPILMFPHGTVTEITTVGFKVRFAAIKGDWHYRNEDIDKIVYLKEENMGRVQEHLDQEAEMERLGYKEGEFQW